jgi:hypothetical protein
MYPNVYPWENNKTVLIHVCTQKTILGIGMHYRTYCDSDNFFRDEGILININRLSCQGNGIFYFKYMENGKMLRIIFILFGDKNRLV